MTSRFIVGDALDVVRTLADGSVDLVATSPPFLALRDYGGVPGQWGQEANTAAFLDRLLDLAVKLRRVLAPHGSIAVELGDTFSCSGGAGGDYSAGGWRYGQPRVRQGSAQKSRGRNPKSGDDSIDWRPVKPSGTGWPQPKSLCLTPALFAASLAYGRNLLDPAHEFEPWLVRNVIVWARNNPPVGALGDKVRPATSYITVACPSPKRWFDLDAVRRPHARDYSRERVGGDTEFNRNGQVDNHTRTIHADPAGSPPLDHWHDEIDGDLLWLINTQGSSLSHYAMWPPTLAERLILMMCPAEVCRTCNEPRRRMVARDTGALAANARKRGPTGADNRASGGSFYNAAHFHSPRTSTIGWSDCGHDGDWRPGVVLDPFCGTGTSLAVAEVHGRDSIGIDLDPANEQLLGPRRDQVRKALLSVEPEVPGQLSLEVAP